MKKILLVIISIYSGILGLTTSCSENDSNYPQPSDITNVKATPAPGSITLSWDLPEDKNIKYVEIQYTIPEFGKSYRKQVSAFASTYLLDGILQKYGPIDFTLQPFNEGGTGGHISTLSAQAEKALPTYGNPEKIKLLPKTMYTNAPFTSRPLSALVDGDLTTFFHSKWQAPTVPLPHYIVIDLGEAVSAFGFKSTNTNRSSDRAWKTLKIYGSDNYDPSKFFDGVALVDGNTVDISQGGAKAITTLTDLPGATGAVYQSDVFVIDHPTRWLWFETTETTDGIEYFALAELEIFKYSVIYPE